MNSNVFSDAVNDKGRLTVLTLHHKQCSCYTVRFSKTLNTCNL